MKLHSCLKILSLICYSFIFIPGMMIGIPFILLLIIGIPDAYPRLKPFLILADLGLIFLAILSFKKINKLTITLESVIFFILLSPLVWMLSKFPLSMFDYSLFYIPLAGFVILYPLSLLFSSLKYRHR